MDTLGIIQLVVIRGLGGATEVGGLGGWRTRLLEERKSRNKNASVLGVPCNVKSLSPGMVAGVEVSLVQKWSVNERECLGEVYNHSEARQQVQEHKQMSKST